MKGISLPPWPRYFFKWTLGICAAGVLIGAITFPLVGLFVETGYTFAQLTLNGIKIMGFFFSIWAPGTALVLTVKKVYEAKQSEQQTTTETTD